MGNGLWHHMTMYHIAIDKLSSSVTGQFPLPIPIVQAFSYTELCINSAISFKGEQVDKETEVLMCVDFK